MMKNYAFSSALLAAVCLLPSCNYHYDVVRFNPVGKIPTSKTPVPSIGIDTNMPKKMFGGSIKSKKPYDIEATYIDSSLTIASAEFTKVTVTYADGTVDPRAFKLKLPVVIQQKYLEELQFHTNGTQTIVKARNIYTEFPKTISRDEAFTLEIEGKFTKDDGSIIPFKLKRKYDLTRQSGTATWVEFVSSI
jgi:hypothetical protein